MLYSISIKININGQNKCYLITWWEKYILGHKFLLREIEEGNKKKIPLRGSRTQKSSVLPKIVHWIKTVTVYVRLK